jgi:SAM-dependent methyltransferase
MQNNRFDDFFTDSNYIGLKNSLYNYLLRKAAIRKQLRRESPKLILEAGSGMSPTVTDTDRIVYSDISLSALKILKSVLSKGVYVVADAAALPFKKETFSHIISSEVLEHLEDDRKTLQEFSRVASSSAVLILTFPHRKAYYANDDHFVSHFRRYELDEMREKSEQAGFEPVCVEKVLGPLEKITMMLAVFFFSLLKTSQHSEISSTVSVLAKWANRLYALLAYLDAKIMPIQLSSVILMKAIRR